MTPRPNHQTVQSLLTLKFYRSKPMELHFTNTNIPFTSQQVPKTTKQRPFYFLKSTDVSFTSEHALTVTFTS